jgi:hypothetical protein
MRSSSLAYKKKPLGSHYGLTKITQPKLRLDVVSIYNIYKIQKDHN